MNASWRRYLGFWGVRVECDVDEELAFHIEMLVRDYIARGMSEDDARRAAERRLGNMPRTRSACLTIGHRRHRRMARAQTLDALQQDLRYAFRTLGRAKGWTIIALLTLGLGIGASTAMFSVLNTLVINPLSYPGADRVATVWRAAPTGGMMVSPRKPMIEAWRKSAHSIEAFEEYSYHPVALAGNTDAVQVIAATIQPDFPTFTGEPLVAGRTFSQDETRTGARRVVILGEGVARDRFGGARNSIGKTVTLDDAPYVVIGVAPASMRLPDASRPHPHLWLPLISDASASGSAIVRVRKGTTLVAASAELDSIVARAGLVEKFGKGFVTRLARPSEFVNFRSSLYLLSGAVALLLVVACANVAHLSLARGATRARELAIRAALGASRKRLHRQLLTESLLLATAGGALGVVIAAAALKILIAVKPARLTQLSAISVDSTVLLIAFSLAALTGLAFGLTAAIDSVRRTTSDSLRNTALAGTASKHTGRLRSLLVVTEMAVSALLLVTATLLVRSVVRLRATDPGFRVENLYGTRLELPDKRYDPATRRVFVAEFAKRARTIPGVLSVTNAHMLPPAAGIMFGDLEAEGTATPVARGTVDESPVDASFFTTVGIPLVQGSPFTAGASQRHDVIINRGFAEQVWHGESAIGKRIRRAAGQPGEWMTVVGVAGDVVRNSLRGNRAEPMVYTPVDPTDGYPPMLVGVRVRAGYDPTEALRGIAKSLDSRLPPPPVTTAAADLADTLATDAFTMLLLAVFAGLAVVLSAIGLYGVISYVVTQRTREIGIRIALGATPRHIATSIVARGLALSAFGLAIGLVVSFWGTKFIRSTLYGVSAGDAVSFGATALMLLGVSAVACLRPTARALSIDPAIAMRGD